MSAQVLNPCRLLRITFMKMSIPLHSINWLFILRIFFLRYSKFLAMFCSNNSLYFFLHIEIIKVICPDCNMELDPTVHVFCYRCGKKVDKTLSIVQKKQGKDACVQYDLHMCIVCLEQSLHKCQASCCC